MADRSISATLSQSGEQGAWDWTRFPTQQDFLTAPETYTLFSGGFGCGKTTVLCAKVIWLLLSVPNNLGFLGRMDGKALRASTMQSLRDMFPEEYISKWNDQQGFMQVAPQYGGSKLVYGDFKDVRDFKNIPLGFFAIDQAEEVPQEIWDYLVGRMRRRTPILLDGLRQYWTLPQNCSSQQSEAGRHYALHGDTHCRLCSKSLPPFNETVPPDEQFPSWDMIVYNRYGFAVANPEGPSHWLFKMFAGLPGKHGVSKGLPDHKAFHATVYDGLRANFVDRKYVTDMENKYSIIPMMWDRYIMGKWVEAEGLVYPGWSRERNVIHRQARRHDDRPMLEPELPMWEWIDHGLTAPTAVGWCVVRPCDCGCGKNDYYVIDEHYEGGKTISYHAACIKLKRDKWEPLFQLKGTYLDSQAFSKTLMGGKGTPKENELFSVADEYADYDIVCAPNQKDWEAGYNRISELLALDPRHRHPVTGELGAPHLYVFNSCDSFIDEAETYKWKKLKSTSKYNEEPQDGNDNHMDALNGFLTSRPAEYAQYNPAEDEPEWLKDLDLVEQMETSHMGL